MVRQALGRQPGAAEQTHGPTRSAGRVESDPFSRAAVAQLDARPRYPRYSHTHTGLFGLARGPSNVGINPQKPFLSVMDYVDRFLCADFVFLLLQKLL